LIAVVDNDLPFLNLMQELLTEEGFRVILHHEGDTAYALIRKEQPDLVILDIRLEHPEAGWKVLELIRLDPETTHIPVIVCSADSSLREKAAMLQDQRCEMLEKPFDLDRLLGTIKAAMDVASLNPEENLDESAD
jgi:DNA-binding response OmpR family regulator